jgi:hypothetical protein
VAETATPRPQNYSIPAADRPPGALVEIGASARLLFDAADAADWNAAGEWLKMIDDSASALPATLSDGELVAQLQSRVNGAGEHVLARERVGTMEDANGLTRLVGELSGQFQSPVPFEAVMLGYYGRQLAIGITAGRRSTLTRAVTDLRTTWDTFRPTVEQRGWTDAARRFTDIVVQLDGANRPADFVAPTRAELAEADRIEKLFQSGT